MAADAAEDHLAWEAKQRTGAAIAALVAGLFTFVGALWRTLIYQDEPRAAWLDSLERVVEPGPIGGLRTLQVAQFQYNDDHAGPILASAVLGALGVIAIGWALTYLAVATRARRPELPRIVVGLPLFGGVLYAVYRVASEYALLRGFDDFLSGPLTVDAVQDADADPFAIFAAIIGFPGVLGLALGIVFVSLNAMRVGLLTRFMGVLGIISGVMLVLPLIAQPVVQTFWLLMLGVLFLGRWPGGSPPAWRTGDAVPWPTSAELREQRARAAAERRGEKWEPPAAEPEPVASGTPSPSASARKRKRKRR